MGERSGFLLWFKVQLIRISYFWQTFFKAWSIDNYQSPLVLSVLRLPFCE